MDIKRLAINKKDIAMLGEKEEVVEIDDNDDESDSVESIPLGQGTPVVEEISVHDSYEHFNRSTSQLSSVFGDDQSQELEDSPNPTKLGVSSTRADTLSRDH